MDDIWVKTYLMQSKMPDFKKRKRQAIGVIEHFLKQCSAPYFSFSGGKDSTAMLCLLNEIGALDVPIFTQSDDLDWDFKESLCRGIISELGFKDYTFSKSNVSVLNQLEGLNDSIDISDCFYGEIQRFSTDRKRNGWCMGIRAEESLKRRITVKNAWKNNLRGVRLCKDGFLHGYPMGFLTGTDVFAIIMQNGCNYSETYDRHEFKAPHELRFSWTYSPEVLLYSGGISWLKRNYFQTWQKLVTKFPELSTIA